MKEKLKNVGRKYLKIKVLVFVAQLVEQMTLNHWVQGSSPCEDTGNNHKERKTKKKLLNINRFQEFFYFYSTSIEAK